MCIAEYRSVWPHSPTYKKIYFTSTLEALQLEKRSTSIETLERSLRSCSLFSLVLLIVRDFGIEEASAGSILLLCSFGQVVTSTYLITSQRLVNGHWNCGVIRALPMRQQAGVVD